MTWRGYLSFGLVVQRPRTTTMTLLSTSFDAVATGLKHLRLVAVASCYIANVRCFAEPPTPQSLGGTRKPSCAKLSTQKQCVYEGP